MPNNFSIQDTFPGNDRVTDTGFWDAFIGKDTFDAGTLESAFGANAGQQYLYAVSDAGELVGVLAYKAFRLYRVVEINLLAKKETCQIPGVGKRLLQSVEAMFRVCCLLLLDASDIDQYYARQGYRKTPRWSFVNLWFDEFDYDGYYKLRL